LNEPISRECDSLVASQEQALGATNCERERFREGWIRRVDELGLKALSFGVAPEDLE
jgi:hypothetical protein